jgi:dihydropteroate synthase
VWAAMNGASVVRVHDVKETVQAFKAIEALKG